MKKGLSSKVIITYSDWRSWGLWFAPHRRYCLFYFTLTSYTAHILCTPRKVSQHNRKKIYEHKSYELWQSKKLFLTIENVISLKFCIATLPNYTLNQFLELRCQDVKMSELISDTKHLLQKSTVNPQIFGRILFFQITLTLKAPITTAAGDTF